MTGSSGFIGFHLSKLLLDSGHQVCGYDGMTDYYDPSLKRKRREILCSYESFSDETAMLEDSLSLDAAIGKSKPRVIVHLAAQAGVRYSIENPRAYIDSNILGTFNVIESATKHKVEHLLMASTSSVYGANTDLPFSETDKADSQLTIYAATKKATEVLAHSNAHIWGLPTTMFRFFTVYGPWGRPDMALFKFAKAILDNDAIDIYNHGKMTRDFTYVTDLVEAISRLIHEIPPDVTQRSAEVVSQIDTLSAVAPYRLVNIGNNNRVGLMDFISALEFSLNKTAKKNFMGMQTGDVPDTWADPTLLNELIGFVPSTNYRDGVKMFVDWYVDYHNGRI